jgi:hypothetical protein
VCEFVAAQAESEAGSGGWTGYRDVFLSAEVQGLIRSHLPRGGAGSPLPSDSAGDGGGGSKKKRKLHGDPAVLAGVSWTVCCFDGTTFSAEVPEHTRVAEMKRAIGRLREVARFSFELFVKGEEDPLDNERRLSSANKVPLFMLQKQVSDRLAVEALFKSCAGADWRAKEGWMTDADLGEWVNVTVDLEGRVIRIVQDYNILAGPLPTGLQQLSALQMLFLSGNQLTGPIPAELGQLVALTVLNLSSNKLAGPLPVELGGMCTLTQLYLHTNQLTGPIPTELGQLGCLAVLQVMRTHISFKTD